MLPHHKFLTWFHDFTKLYRVIKNTCTITYLIYRRETTNRKMTKQEEMDKIITSCVGFIISSCSTCTEKKIYIYILMFSWYIPTIWLSYTLKISVSFHNTPKSSILTWYEMWLVYGTYGKDVGLFFFFEGCGGVWGRFIESLQPFYKLEVCIILTRDIFCYPVLLYQTCV